MKLIIFLYYLILFLFLSTGELSAAYNAIAPIPSVNTSSTPDDYIASLYIWGIGIVGILALAQLIRGGIMYMVAGAVNTKGAAKEIIINAFLGLILALGSFLLLNIINPELTKIHMPVFNQEFLPGTGTGGGTLACGNDAKDVKQGSGFTCIYTPTEENMSSCGIPTGTTPDITNMPYKCTPN